jgi:DNA mismatch repair protein MutS2
MSRAHTTPTDDAIPDLLSRAAACRVDGPALRQWLVFGFVVGGTPEACDEVLGATSLPASRWDRTQFARDLYLDDLVTRALPVVVGAREYAPCKAYLLRAIAEPPRDSGEIAFRRGVLAELAENAAFRADFERVYDRVVQLRTLLCASRHMLQGLRRLEILRTIRDTLKDLAESFEGATSGLARLPAFGRRVTTGEAYRTLEALLDHEGHLGTLDLRVRVGSDGEIRMFQIVAVRENQDNPFHTSAIGRFFARLRLLLRGYRMNGGEIVERLFDDVFSGLEADLVLLFQLLGDMEVYLAALGLRARAEANGLSVCLPDLGVDDGDAPRDVELTGLFNPLLLGGARAPVPCDVRVGGESVVVVTGPNSGGKTRLLQAIALTQMLGEAGFFVPAGRARLPRAAGLFVSLLDEARADQPEGQLGMELIRIRRMFEQLEVGSLVLLDELCSGTNPSEGEEIAQLVLSLLPELRARVFVTTHLLQFAARLADERPSPRLTFLQVELGAHDVPTYRFVPGVARTSLAHKTAARLGVTRDELLALIAEKRRGGESTARETSPSDGAASAIDTARPG